jgi:hypothetical protein
VIVRVRSAWLVLSLAACGGGQSASVGPAASPDGVGVLDQTRWTWVSAICDDGTHDLDARGFDDRVHITAVGRGLRLVHDLTFATEGCAETVVTWASADGAAFRFVDQARVADALDRSCVATWPLERSGEVHQRGDALELRMYRSSLCGGYDIRHQYRRVEAQRLDDHGLVRHMVAGWVLRDAEMVVRHYAAGASLIVPRPAADGGGQLRFEGRNAARGWFTGMVRSVAWIGARILDISEPEPGRYVARVEYMDSGLANPLQALFTVTIADGEIYEAQLAFASSIVPRLELDAGSPLPDAASLPDTGAP